MKRYTLYLLSILAFLSTLAACKKDAAPVPDAQPKMQVPQPGSPDEVVLVTDAIKLTMHDYDRCIDIHRLKGHVLNERVLANPRFQRGEVQLCLQAAYMKHYLKDNHAQVLPVERQTELKNAMERAGVQSEAALADKLGVTGAVLNEIVDDALVPAVMQRVLATQIEGDAAKRHFMRDERKYTIEIADFDNTPDETDVELFMQNAKEKLSAYISSHPEVVMTLPKADFARFAYAIGGDTDEQHARQYAEALKLLRETLAEASAEPQQQEKIQADL